VLDELQAIIGDHLRRGVNLLQSATACELGTVGETCRHLKPEGPRLAIADAE
jgi:hypothetical protein